MSIPACNARDLVQFPADERNTLFLARISFGNTFGNLVKIGTQRI